MSAVAAICLSSEFSGFGTRSRPQTCAVSSSKGRIDSAGLRIPAPLRWQPKPAMVALTFNDAIFGGMMRSTVAGLLMVAVFPPALDGVPATAATPTNPLGVFDGQSDVGSVSPPGTA